MRSLPLSCHAPKLWLTDYEKGHMTKHELFGYLIMCAKSMEPETIVAAVPENLLSEFKAVLQEMGHAQSDGELTFVGESPFFGVAEIQKILRCLAR